VNKTPHLFRVPNQCQTSIIQQPTCCYTPTWWPNMSWSSWLEIEFFSWSEAWNPPTWGCKSMVWWNIYNDPAWLPNDAKQPFCLNTWWQTLFVCFRCRVSL